MKLSIITKFKKNRIYLKHGLKSIFLMFMCFIFITSSVTGADNKKIVANKKMRIAYCQSEAFVDYTSTLYYIIRGLGDKGIVNGSDSIPYIKGSDDSSLMWKWLANNDMGPRIEFIKDGYYDLKNTANGDVVSNLVNRVKEKKDVDMIITMGTKAGVALSKADITIPILIFSTSDPIGSGIISSETDSGKDNVWAQVDKKRFQRQIQAFNDIFKFKKMGLVYEKSPIVENYIALKDIQAMASERNFEIVTVNVKEAVNDDDKKRYYSELAEAYKNLSSKVDVMFLSISTIESQKLPTLLTPFYQKQIPVFSQLGADEVKNGALMSVTMYDFENFSEFGAYTIEKIMEGVKPRQLAQTFQGTPQIVLNLEVAKKCGYKIPIDILLVADKVYRNIAK